MSYDYQALVNRIHQALPSSFEDAIEAFEELSLHCPMTPLLWMQYAHTAGRALQETHHIETSLARELQIQTLQLALEEFPGYAALNYQYIQLLREREPIAEKDGSIDFESELQLALDRVGRGSHCSPHESKWVVPLYRWQAEHYLLSGKKDAAIQSFLQRASQFFPENDSLTHEVRELSKQYQLDTEPLLASLEKVRRERAGQDSRQYEDSIETALQREGIRLDPQEVSNSAVPPTLNEWEPLLRPGNRTSGMGLGGVESAQEFVNFAEQIQQSSLPKCAALRALVQSVYERGVAECPTVELLWESYLTFLLRELMKKDYPVDEVSYEYLQRVTRRAFRNCPYSCTIVQLRMEMYTSLVMRNPDNSVFDPDTLELIAKEAMDMKFLVGPDNYVEMRLCQLRLIKNFILFLLSGKKTPYCGVKGAFDDSLRSKERCGTCDIDEEEVKDLCDDLEELYETIDKDIQKLNPSWTECRAAVYADEALTRRLLLDPLTNMDHTLTQGNKSKAYKAYENASRVSNPPNPDDFIQVIRLYMDFYEVKGPSHVLQRILHVRGLFEKGAKAFGSGKLHLKSRRDLDASLTNYLYEWKVFERTIGSKKNLRDAEGAMKKKMIKNGIIGTEPVPVSDEVTLTFQNSTIGNTPNHERDDSRDSGPNLSGIDETMAIEENREENLGFKAHPLTIKVSNLNPETDDIDVLELFKLKCGPVSHARIIREKSGPMEGKSKCRALVQFEDRASVLRAVSLNDIVGLHERTLTIERSPIPAIPLVPPGRNRVNPKGEGKYSKRNQKKRGRDDVSANWKEAPVVETGNPVSQPTEENILLFRPRGLKKKARVSLSKG